MDFNLKGKRSLLAAVLFFAVVTAFFYAVIAGTMPKYKAVSGSEQLSQTDLSRPTFQGNAFRSDFLPENTIREGCILRRTSKTVL